MRIHEALMQAHAAGVARLDAQWLLCHLLTCPRTWLLAHDDDTLPAAALLAWPALLARRAGGEPLAYVIGEREFCGLALQVTPAVLVPRPETEVLVHWALECLPAAPAPRVIDLGTGSGAIALALLKARPDIDMLATDASASAIAVAQANARRLGRPRCTVGSTAPSRSVGWPPPQTSHLAPRAAAGPRRPPAPARPH